MRVIKDDYYIHENEINGMGIQLIKMRVVLPHFVQTLHEYT